jgi:CrcB protein
MPNESTILLRARERLEGLGDARPLRGDSRIDDFLMMTWLAVALGGALGSLARHGVNVVTARSIGRALPYATFTVNIIGSFTIGLLAGLLAAERMDMTPALRAFVFVGVLGGFTTFSSYMLDTLTLADGGHVAAALFNVVGQVVVGYAAAYAGFRLGLRFVL